jgi:hypothetical protein
MSDKLSQAEELLQFLWVPRQLGFDMGIPRVGNFDTVPVPADTIPVSGMGTYCTISAAVSYETHGIFSTCGLFGFLVLFNVAIYYRKFLYYTYCAAHTC